jgi:hypothetical protein
MGNKFRVITYIDGFNLYYSIKRLYQSENTPYPENAWREAIWLDLVKLSESFLTHNQELVAVKYFTARITKPAKKYHRQNTYLEALATLDKYRLFLGEYYYNTQECWYCHREFPNPKEKKSDVNLATEILIDAIDDNYDTAILVAADSDYETPLEVIKNRFPEKRIIVEFVKETFSYRLAELAKPYVFKIDRDRLASCQLPDEVISLSGAKLTRPASWK